MEDSLRFALCVDDFNTSKETVDPFLRLAGSCGASIDIVHALVVSTSTGEAWSGSAERVDGRIDEQLRETRVDAERALAPIAALASTAVNIVVIPATDVAQALLTHCDAEQYDLIGLASHSPREGEGEPRLGSVASDVVVQSTIPVCILYPYPKLTDIIDPEALAEGSFVFTSDGHELGVVAEVRADRFKVKSEDDEIRWLPRTAVAGAVSGRTELHFTRSGIDEQVLPAP